MGLIGAAFLTPDYDITFSQLAKKRAPYKLRRGTDRYQDLCLLSRDTQEPIVYFGGKDYVPLFYRLTSSVKGTRTIFYNTVHPPERTDACSGSIPPQRKQTGTTNAPMPFLTAGSNCRRRESRPR